MLRIVSTGQAETLEGDPVVWPAGHGQVLPGQGRGDRGKQLDVFLGVVGGPDVQVAGRV